jgi:alpha/beta superfamily hydrolase
VGGSLDDISPLKDLLAFYEELKTEKYLKVVTTTHFFGGKEREIAGFIIENFGKTKG